MNAPSRWLRAAAAVSLLVTGCAHVEPLIPGTAADPRVQQLELGIANVYLVMGTRPILVDTGAADTGDRLEAALAEYGVKPHDLALIVLTHGHADHAGGAKRLHALSGAPVLSHAGDLEMLQAGHNRPLKPMGFLGSILRPFVDGPFAPVTPDILITEDFDLRPYGIEGVVRPMPGHTPGSLGVVLASGKALVGDMLAGSPVHGAWPMRHYFHDDCRAAEAHVEPLVQAGSKVLYLGHGGPVDGQAAISALRADPCPK